MHAHAIWHKAHKSDPDLVSPVFVFVPRRRWLSCRSQNDSSLIMFIPTSMDLFRFSSCWLSQSLPYQIEFKWNMISVCILCLCQLPNGFFQCIIHCDVLGDFWVLCLKESSNSLHIVTSHEFLYIADLWWRVAINISRIK